MRTNSTLEAALHIMLVLANVPGSREVAAGDLAAFHELSPTTMAKVLQQLSGAGLVAGSAGRYGGYRLTRPADAISVYDVASAIGGVEPQFQCHEIRRRGPCSGAAGGYSRQCVIARVMQGAQQAWRDSLAATSIADLAGIASTEAPGEVLSLTGDWIGRHSRNQTMGAIS